MRLQKSSPWFCVYEGEETPPAGTPPAGTPPVVEDKKFSQADLNKFLADDRRKHEKKVQETITQLEELKKAKGLSDQERGEFQTRIDEMTNSLLTKEEQAKRDKEKMEKQFKTELETERKEREKWQGFYRNESISNQITAAASKAKAFSVEQLQAILMPHTRITEVLSEDGKPTGVYAPKVKFQDKDKEGKSVELDLTIEETVKRMKELPERFGNLFESETSGGLGGSGSNRGVPGGDSSKPPTDPAKYREWRKKQLR